MKIKTVFFCNLLICILVFTKQVHAINNDSIYNFQECNKSQLNNQRIKLNSPTDSIKKKNFWHYFGFHAGYQYSSNSLQTKTSIPLQEMNFYSYNQNIAFGIRTPIINLTKTWSPNLKINQASYYNQTEADIYGMITLADSYKSLKPLKYFVFFGPIKYNNLEIGHGDYSIKVKREYALMYLLERERYYETFSNNSLSDISDQAYINRINTRYFKLNIDYGAVIEHFYQISVHRGTLGKSDNIIDIFRLFPIYSWTPIWSKVNIDYTDKLTGNQNSISATGRGSMMGVGLNYWNYFFNNRLFVKINVLINISGENSIEYYFENTPPVFLQVQQQSPNNGFTRDLSLGYFKIKVALNI